MKNKFDLYFNTITENDKYYTGDLVTCFAMAYGSSVFIITNHNGFLLKGSFCFNSLHEYDDDFNKICNWVLTRKQIDKLKLILQRSNNDLKK